MSSLRRSNSIVKVVALPRVRKVLTLENLEFSILLDERADGYRIAFEHVYVGGRGHDFPRSLELLSAFKSIPLQVNLALHI